MRYQKEIVVLGFPKCATSALVKALSGASDTRLLRAKSGALELPFESLMDVRPQDMTDDILIHKYAAYVYAPSSMRQLFEINPRMTAVLCYRNPVKILVSWWNMHRKIAQTGSDPAHFAYQERAFYADCSIEDYYETFAKPRMGYAALLARLLRFFPADRLLAVDQAAFARDPEGVRDAILEVSRTGVRTPLSETGSKTGFRGFADTTTVDVPDAIQQALQADYMAFKATLRESGIFDLVLPAPAQPAPPGTIPALPTLAEFRAFVEPRKMVLEAIVSDIYTRRCAGRAGFALFDGGAHRAYHTLRMLALPGCERVYAVEADPFMAETFRDVLADKAPEAGDRVVLLKRAIQNDPDVHLIDWKSSPSHAGRSSIVSANADRRTIWEGTADMQYREDMRVPATTIDKILQGEPRPLPFLKLDLEGADLLALMGATQTLRSKRPVVAFENSVHAPKVHGFTLDQIAAYFADLDYVPLNVLGEPIGPENWFGFFEAWAAPREDVGWLQEALARSIVRHMR